MYMVIYNEVEMTADAQLEITIFNMEDKYDANIPRTNFCFSVSADTIFRHS